MAQALNRLLRIAVVGGVEASVRLHIDRGDDINARDDRGLTPMMLAASRNKPGVCRLLIDSGADLFALDLSGRDALAIARALGAFDSAAAIEAALVERRATGDPAPRGFDTATLPGSVTVETKLGAPSTTVAPVSPDEATMADGTDADPGAPDRFRHPPATLAHPAGQIAALPTVLTGHEPRLLTGSYVVPDRKQQIPL